MYLLWASDLEMYLHVSFFNEIRKEVVLEFGT